MALQTYERGAFFLDGQLLVEAQSVDADFDPALNEIKTMQKGFAGVSPGSETCKLSISEALPRAGADFDAISAMQGTEILEAVLFAGSKKFKTKGYISSVKMKLGVDTAAGYSFDMLCGPIEQTTL
jgi:hypothetical protein